MKNLTERARRIINTRHDLLKPNKVFTFVNLNDVKLEAICIALVNNYHNEEFKYDDYKYLCYSQNGLFYLHLIHYLSTKEYYIRDYNETLVDLCVIPEYDKKLDDVVE
jgi:hypothetical protein